MNIYLVRHTTVDVPAGHAYGFTDVPLRSTFEAEAEQVRQQLQGLDFDKVWTSPLSRCVRLANYCGYQDAARDPRLREINMGEWEMKPWDAVTADPQSEAWFADWVNTPTPGGESLMDQYCRVSDFLNEIQNQADLNNVCLFAHGGVLTCARIYAGMYELKEAFKNLPAYGEVIRITL
ncbi:MAG: alpha-ribazole phosphatase [Parabacteroides sp.]|nr:alpha-ribazole phosphatase [Parabacteroides sp.]